MTSPSDTQVPSDGSVTDAQPTCLLRWWLAPGESGTATPRLQQKWRVRYWQHGCIQKQFEEWRDVPEETFYGY